MPAAKSTNTSTSAAAAALVRHRPAVTRGADEFGATYRLMCTCGRTGEAHQVRSLARTDLDRHLTTLPLVPEHQQCRDPHRHDCRPWEPCALCEGQEALFGLTGPAVRESR
ncbi:hypothetical protein [Microbispora sp. H10670]|uniref:hypothetical protein n=1 Tax=Microbispora sp. H10670 TaxID=2729108 RepID=UPI0016049B97|nr:hypothetical protein [Microbispora sp. H10670]